MYPLVSKSENFASQVAGVFVLFAVVLFACFVAGGKAHEAGLMTNCPHDAQAASEVIGVPADRLVPNHNFSVPAWTVKQVAMDEPPYLINMRFGYYQSNGGVDSWDTLWPHPSQGGTWTCVYPQDPTKYRDQQLAKVLNTYTRFGAHVSILGGEIHLNNGGTAKDCFLSDAPAGGFAFRTNPAKPVIVKPDPLEVGLAACPDMGNPVQTP